ncbi:hypothetical protein [Candidatus Puniceispirillum sp.]|uniref:hypothetical protein n=1 Tax=Candidatus Puniceispirillum sp. TaxID=2026719 RepID=UPI003F69B958
MAMRETGNHKADAVMADRAVIIQHSRTEQQMVVSLADYQLYATARFRNWRLSERNNGFRPPTTISEFLYANDSAVQERVR